MKSLRSSYKILKQKIGNPKQKIRKNKPMKTDHNQKSTTQTTNGRESKKKRKKKNKKV